MRFTVTLKSPHIRTLDLSCFSTTTMSATHSVYSTGSRIPSSCGRCSSFSTLSWRMYGTSVLHLGQRESWPHTPWGSPGPPWTLLGTLLGLLLQTCLFVATLPRVFITLIIPLTTASLVLDASGCEPFWHLGVQQKVHLYHYARHWFCPQLVLKMRVLVTMLFSQFLLMFFNQSPRMCKFLFLSITLIFIIQRSLISITLLSYSRGIAYTPLINPCTTFNLIPYITQVEPVVNPVLSGLVKVANLFRHHTLLTLWGNGFPELWRSVCYFLAKISEGVLLAIPLLLPIL